MNFKDTEAQVKEITEIFNEARNEDDWNLDEPMLYSYYFVDTDVDKLEKLGEQLHGEGYDFIDIFELGDEETDESTGEYLLHIDRVETHTPESLAQRNAEFARLAEENEIASYDGWEFGEAGDEDDDEEIDVDSPS